MPTLAQKQDQVVTWAEVTKQRTLNNLVCSWAHLEEDFHGFMAGSIVHIASKPVLEVHLLTQLHLDVEVDPGCVTLLRH